MENTPAYDNYTRFAERYDLFFESFNEREASVEAFFSRLFAENKVKSVLDCACGTGRDLCMLKQIGCDVYGSDISDAMLAQAAKNLASCGVYDVPLKRADYRLLSDAYNRKFGAVLCLATAISEMPDEKEIIRAFKSMRDVLEDGGVLVLTQGTSDRQSREKPRFMLARNTRDFTRLFVLDYDRPKIRYNIMDITHSEKESGLKTWSIDLLILLQEDQERLLKEAGFRRIDFFGDFFFTPYDRETSRRIITVAYK